MNQQDQDNLQFILNASQEVLNDWYSSISDDDREYAHLLLDIRAAELKDAAVALRIEAELAVNPDYSEAKSILDKIAKPQYNSSMMREPKVKTNQQKNQEHDARQQAKVRPAKKEYSFQPLESVMQKWSNL